MSEALVMNLFFTVRVFLVGTILLILPRITRKGLLFGVYVGEEFSGGTEARQLLRGWRFASLVVMAVSLMVGYAISFGLFSWFSDYLFLTALGWSLWLFLLSLKTTTDFPLPFIKVVHEGGSR